MRRLESIARLSSPLILLSKAPENKDTRQHARKHKREPGALGDFGEYGREIHAVEGGEDDEDGEDQEGVEAPDDDGNNGDHAGCDEGDEDNADAVSVAEGGCLCGGGKR